MDANAITNFISENGLPTLLLLIFLVFTYKTFAWVGEQIDMFIPQYLQLLKDQVKASEKNAKECHELQKATLTAIAELGSMLKEMQKMG